MNRLSLDRIKRMCYRNYVIVFSSKEYSLSSYHLISNHIDYDELKEHFEIDGYENTTIRNIIKLKDMN